MTDFEGRKHHCGGAFHRVFEEAEYTIRGTTVQVSREAFRCDRCEEVRVSLESEEKAEVEAANAVRAELGLLAPEEIRELRKELEYTQEQFEAALGLGTKTVVRWESGSVMQSKAADNLLRAVRRDRTLIGFLSGEEAGQPQIPAWSQWPKWEDLPRKLRVYLRNRSRAESAPVSSVLVMLLSEEMTAKAFDKTVKELFPGVWPIPVPHSAAVEPWLRTHREEYGQAS